MKIIAAEKSESSLRRPIKAVAFILGSMIVGALGSGLWERAGSPMLDWTIEATVSLIDIAFTSYRDSIYRDAALGFYEGPSSTLLQLVYIAPVYGFLIYLFTMLTGSPSPDDPGKVRISKLHFWTLNFFAAVALFMMMIAGIRQTYVNGVATFAEKTLDRIAPFIDEQQEEELLSEFRGVTSKAEYKEFRSRLLSICKQNGVETVGNDFL